MTVYSSLLPAVCLRLAHVLSRLSTDFGDTLLLYAGALAAILQRSIQRLS